MIFLLPTALCYSSILFIFFFPTMPRTPKKTPSASEPPQEPQKPNSLLQPVQIIKKNAGEAVPPKPPEPPAVEPAKPISTEIKSAEIKSVEIKSAEIKSPVRPRSEGFRKPIPKAEIPVIEKATGANGEVFNIADQVLITEPFGARIGALIDSFYADTQGEIWACLKPVEVNPECRWEQGCIRSQALVKAE
jgi:hypothetical protein